MRELLSICTFRQSDEVQILCKQVNPTSGDSDDSNWSCNFKPQAEIQESKAISHRIINQKVNALATI